MRDERSFQGPFVITGLSGSGKTVLSRSLEDLGYLCVDNIPLELVPDLFARSEGHMSRLVVVLDVRTQGFAQRFPEVHAELRRSWPSVRVIYVEASPEALLQRFSVARRPHPLRGESLEQAIAEEQEVLADVRTFADLLIDTTRLNPHQLRRQALDLGGVEDPRQLLELDIESFSYLQGVPPAASLVFDVRFLPNPYFVETLRSLPGDHPDVERWMEQFPEVHEALGRIIDLILYLLPRYGEELKTHLGIALGCTGGRHRSVYMGGRIAEAVRAAGYNVVLHHRDKDRWRSA